MADLAVWQRTIVDEKGDIIPGAEVSVRSYPGGSLITLYEGPDGTQAKGNPFSTGADGFARFWAESQRAEIVAHGAGSTIRWVVDLLNADEVIGDAVTEATAAAAVAVSEAKAEADRAEAARDAAQLNARIYPNTAAGLAATTDGDYFSVPSPDSDDYLILYRNDSGSATEVERYPSADVVHRLSETVGSNQQVGLRGNLGSIAYDGAIGNGNHLIILTRMPGDGQITQLEIHTQAASDDIRVEVYDAPEGLDPGQSVQILASVLLTCSAGLNVSDVTLPFKAGHYIGIYSPAGVVSRIDDTGPQVAHGSGAGTSFTISPRVNNSFGFRLTYTTGLDYQTDTLYGSLLAQTQFGFLGDLEDPTTDGAMVGGYNVIQQEPSSLATLTQVLAHAEQAGTGYVRIYDAPDGIEPGKPVSVKQSQAVEFSAGYNAFDVNLSVEEGQYVGIYAPPETLSRGPSNAGPLVSYGGDSTDEPFEVANTTDRTFYVRLITTRPNVLNLQRRVAALERAEDGSSGVVAPVNILSTPACLFLGGNGQSNMVGSDDAITLRQEYGAKGFSNNDDTVQPLVAPDVGDQEYPGFGAARYLREAMMFSGGPSHRVSGSQIIVGRAARGGTAIADLSKANDTYGIYDNSLQQIVAALGEAGDNDFLHLGQMWVQGERDAVNGTSRSDYKSLIKQLAEDYDNDARDIAPGGYQRPLFAAQITSTLGYTSAPNGWEIAMAQLEASHEHPLISMVGPLYHVGWSDDRHLDSQGYRIAGALLGRAAYHYATTGALFEALQVVDSYIDGDDIVLVYNKRGLVLDTTTVPLQTQHGFAAWDDQENAVSVINVAASGNEVRLTCASTPGSGWKWSYGNLQATGMAPYLGGAGNLRDSAGDEEAIDGHPLHNWAVLQEGVLP